MLIFSSPRLIVTNLCGNFVTIKQTPLLVFPVFHKLVKFVGNASDLLSVEYSKWRQIFVKSA